VSVHPPPREARRRVVAAQRVARAPRPAGMAKAGLGYHRLQVRSRPTNALKEMMP